VTVDVAEIDPEVISVAEQYFNVDHTDPRLHIYNQDGRIFLQQTDEKYDSVILDAYSKSYVPFHLMTEEFFRLLANHMKANGTVVSNLIAQSSGGDSQLLAAEIKTMETVFPNVYAFATRGTDYPSVQNIIVLASLSVNHLTEPGFARLAAAQKTPPAQLPNDIGNYFVMATSNAPLLTDNYAPVETLLNPMTGQPLNAQESNLYMQDAAKVIALLLIMAVVFLILHRRRLL
jgi:spermidine synthase